MRLVVTAEDYDQALAFYRDALGLRERASHAPAGGHVTILDAGQATLELTPSRPDHGATTGAGDPTPTALLHDGLVQDECTRRTDLGPEVDLEEADRILRNALAALGGSGTGWSPRSARSTPRSSRPWVSP